MSKHLIVFLFLDLKMDFASVLLGLVICVITAVVLYLISVKSFQVRIQVQSGNSDTKILFPPGEAV